MRSSNPERVNIRKDITLSGFWINERQDKRTERIEKRAKSGESKEKRKFGISDLYFRIWKMEVTLKGLITTMTLPF